MNNLIIMGAGASRECGGPLMSDFLDKADELVRIGADGVAKATSAFRNVFDAISELQAVHAKSYLDLDNIEAVFGTIEMGVMLNKLAGRDTDSIKKLRQDMVTLIYKTLESCILFPVQDGRVIPPAPYNAFAQSFGNVHDESVRKLFEGLSIITFNYDLALDYALQWNLWPFRYHLEDTKRHDAVPLLKLHGSINWGVCQECKAIVPYPLDQVRFNLFGGTRNVRFDLGSSLSTRTHCSKPLLSSPVIVPPTWNKTEYQGQLETVWRTAAEAFAAAENIFVVGYSLPETDSFFRYLYALGSESKSRIRRFWVFDPDATKLVEGRFRKLIGRGIESRFQFRQLTFSEAIPIIAEAIKAA